MTRAGTLVRTFCSQAIAATTISLLIAAPTRAQCNSTKYAQDQSVNGSIRMQAVTTQINCANRTVWVRAWLENVGTSCTSGTPQSYYCISHNASASTSVTVSSQVCGYVTGQSRHWYYQGTSLFEFAPLPTPLYAGDCAQIACANQGPDYYWNGSECVYTPGSPIIIATGQDTNYKLTSAEDGVQFDIDGDGAFEQIAWTRADSPVAFLAIDRDGDGLIKNGTELFGNHTYQGVTNGFAALAKMNMDSNGGIARGSVSSDDPLFAKLLLWTDTNHNGISESFELRPASELFSDIGLSYEIHQRRDGFGNEFRFKGWVTLRTGPGRNRAELPPEQFTRKRTVYDVFFKIGNR